MMMFTNAIRSLVSFFKITNVKTIFYDPGAGSDVNSIRMEYHSTSSMPN